jgi:hypothetical protein
VEVFCAGSVNRDWQEAPWTGCSFEWTGAVVFFCDCDIIDPFTDRSKALKIV